MASRRTSGGLSVYQCRRCQGTQIRHTCRRRNFGRSRQIYGFGLQCKPEDIVDRWNKAQSNPIPPKIVEKAPVHEEVHRGSSLMEKGGLGEFRSPPRLRDMIARRLRRRRTGLPKILRPASSTSATTADKSKAPQEPASFSVRAITGAIIGESARNGESRSRRRW